MAKWFVLWDDQTGQFGAASSFRRQWVRDLFSAPFWPNIPDKPFSTLGSEFKVSNGELQVNSIDFSKIANRKSSLLTFDSSITPNADNTYDLGSSSLRWRNGYFAGSIKALPVYQGYESITKDLAFAVGARFENVLARRNIVSVEYYDETTGQWVPWDVDVTPLFDDDISWGWLRVDYTHRKFRITVDAGTYGEYSHFLFVWGNSSEVNGHTITIETSSDLKTWANEGTLSGGDCYYTQEIFAKFDIEAVYTSTRPYLRFTFDIDMNDTGSARLVEILGFMFRVVHLGSGHKPFIALYDKSVRFRNTIFPEVDNAYDLGKSTNRWRNVYFAGTLTGGVGNLSSLQIGGTEIVDSNRNLKNIASISQNWLPTSDNSYDLGSSSLRWRNGYFAGAVSAGTLQGNLDWSYIQNAPDFALSDLSNVSDSSILTKLKNVDGSGSGLDADLLDGKQAGNASGQIPISNGTKCTDLNADLLDGYHAGNSSGQIPISNGTKCTNLNADMVDGEHASAFTHARNGGKNIWVQSTAPTAQAVGDIWIQT